MPEHRADLVAPGGSYPPMAPLRGAVAGWLPDDPLTPVSTPAAARAVLGAEAQTSVLDPVGLRRLWWQGVHLVVVLVWVGLAVLASVQYLTSDRLPGWWLPFIILVLPLNLAGG